MMIEICNPNIPNRKRNKQISNIDKDYIRKKRNRISAQKARDRKKSYMDVLEKEIETLRKENCMLLTSNKLLEKEVTSLKEKNVQDKLNEVEFVNQIDCSSSAVTVISQQKKTTIIWSQVLLICQIVLICCAVRLQKKI